jgi:hypothetical protein
MFHIGMKTPLFDQHLCAMVVGAVWFTTNFDVNDTPIGKDATVSR